MSRALTRCSSAWFGTPQAQTASYWASRVSQVVVWSCGRGRSCGPPSVRTPACRPGQRDLLGDEAAQGEADDVDLHEAEGVEQGHGVPGHLGDRPRGRAAGCADAGVVEGHDMAAGGQRVDQRGVPIVEVAAEVLEQDQRHVAVPVSR
jgi:hypothetical protein